MSTLRLAAAVVLLSAPLAACGGSGDDKLARQVEKTADSRADQLEQRADDLKDQAEQVRKVGEKRADAIDAADLNTHAMSPEQKAAIVNNQAPAVR
jgi:outer membrane PBP1 activator LpoA protein